MLALLRKTEPVCWENKEMIDIFGNEVKEKNISVKRVPDVVQDWLSNASISTKELISSTKAESSFFTFKKSKVFLLPDRSKFICINGNDILMTGETKEQTDLPDVLQRLIQALLTRDHTTFISEQRGLHSISLINETYYKIVFSQYDIQSLNYINLDIVCSQRGHIINVIVDSSDCMFHGKVEIQPEDAPKGIVDMIAEFRKRPGASTDVLIEIVLKYSSSYESYYRLKLLGTRNQLLSDRDEFEIDVYVDGEGNVLNRIAWPDISIRRDRRSEDTANL